MATFLESIGIEMRSGKVEVDTLFPGSLIHDGSLLIEEPILVAAMHCMKRHTLPSPPRSDERMVQGFWMMPMTAKS